MRNKAAPTDSASVVVFVLLMDKEHLLLPINAIHVCSEVTDQREMTEKEQKDINVFLLISS